MSLSKDQILNAADDCKELVSVPEWGGDVYVRVMSGTSRDRFEASCIGDTFKDIRARLAAYTVCDDSGSLLFSEGDIKALGEKSGAALTRIYSVAVKINSLSKTDIDELEKN